MKLKEYPSCHQSLINFINSNEIYLNTYKKLNIILFDSSLRDGIQNVNINELKNYNTNNKINLFNKIIEKYKPDYIEIGSIVSKKYFPIFSDSLEVFDKTDNQYENKKFILVPSLNKLKICLNSKCKNFSFISSVSESFQIANTNKTIDETKKEILEMIKEINLHIYNPIIKIYISCINYCPIQGKINTDIIVNEIIYYHNVCNPDIICLSDTCASLTLENFIDIIDKVNKKGILNSKLSLHLHINKTNDDYYENLQKIFNEAIEREIRHFDISLLETGGCIMTMKSEIIKPNLSYDVYYKLLVDYLISKEKNK